MQPQLLGLIPFFQVILIDSTVDSSLTAKADENHSDRIHDNNAPDNSHVPYLFSNRR